MIKTMLILAALATPAYSGGNDFVIRRDMGGDMQEYIDLAKQLSEEGARVVINGRCASSCLLFLHSDYGLDVCATQWAMLGYHMPYFTDGEGRVLPDPNGDRFKVAATVLAGLPPNIRKHFVGKPLPDVYKGAKSGDMKWIKGNYIARVIGAC